MSGKDMQNTPVGAYKIPDIKTHAYILVCTSVNMHHVGLKWTHMFYVLLYFKNKSHSGLIVCVL